jgi:Trypsin-like peptidase domain
MQRRRLTTLLTTVCLLCAASGAQKSGGVSGGTPTFRVVRSISGTRGAQQGGRYVIEDPRSTFYIPADKQVIVYFDWEGPRGKHHFEGVWKNPDGKLVAVSEFDYEATSNRFGGFWQFDLTSAIKPGVWALEAHIDGEVVGSHTFEVIASDKPASAATSAPRVLPPADIYNQAQAVTAGVEALAADGRRLRTGSAFIAGDGLWLTAFQMIDGAATLRLALPDGTRTETKTIAAWDRLRDWALLRAETRGIAPLKRAAPGSWAVGDRVFTLDVPSSGNRVLVDESITGKQTFSDLGPRLNLSNLAAVPAVGAPVLNEFGEVMGVLGGSLFPGMPSGFGNKNIIVMQGLREGSLATPMEAIPVEPSAGGKTLTELDAMNEFVRPLVNNDELLYGIVGTHVQQNRGQWPSAGEQKTEFSHADGVCQIVLLWNPRGKLRGKIALAVYDVRNHQLNDSKPVPIKLNSGTYATSSFELQLAALRAGMYRADVLYDDVPVWRAYFRVVD